MPNSPDTSRSGRPLLSITTVLILSAFLIGVAVQDLLPDASKMYAIAAAGVGLLGYLALDFVAARRKERDARFAQERLDSMLDSRMKRHRPTENRTGNA